MIGSRTGQVSVADGTPLAAEKLERLLTNDSGTGVIRHVDAGYERAIEVAEQHGVRIPMLEAARAAAEPDTASKTPAVAAQSV
ncbi:hypothetical protein [Promicromonospora soli]|uniref:Urocanase C-terminal domain-containing protein n=1 Tax=Promicromonospora soli TaxID=2035533 RepID=A0A919FWX9_9MICO|nr:hypothetical protein [Promicromonospora soli]GHH73306.1 hypothetical protein GCM10017772_24370 [Promicromonospora soli]